MEDCGSSKTSSIMEAFGQLDNDVNSLETQIEKLNKLIEPALSSDKQPETSTAAPDCPDTCDVQANIHSVARKITRIRENVVRIQSRVQL